MVSEIGLAQKRLLDDEASDAKRRLSMPLPSTASFSNGTIQQADSGGLNSKSHGFEYPGEYAHFPPPASEVQVALPYPHQPRLVEIANPRRPNTDNDDADLETSYNIFDTSLNGTVGPNTNTLPSYETIPTEAPYRMPNRSKSMQATSFSPHDTEPFSSLNVGRSKSDNNAHQYQDPPQEQFSADANSPDELSAPVAVEIPMVQQPKKRARKIKQTQPEDDEDDELAAPSENKGLGENNNNTKPRKKNMGHQSMDDQAEIEPKAYQEPDSNAQHTTDSFGEDNFQTPHPENDLNQLVSINIPQSQVHPAELEPAREQERTHPAESETPNPKSSRSKNQRSKKKKIKRGKTTSVTVKRTHEPDVEGDVIWIDEREPPSNPDPDHDRRSIQEHSIPTPDSISITVDEHVEPQTSQTMIEIPNFVPEGQGQDDQEPAQPKKRGQKRKKTSEQIPAQQEPEPQAQPQADAPADRPLPPNAGEDSTPYPASPGPKTPKKQPNTHPDIIGTNGDNNDNDNDNDNNNDNDNDNETISKKKAPMKHSPIAGTSKVPYRVGLSRRARIAPLLKIIRR